LGMKSNVSAVVREVVQPEIEKRIRAGKGLCASKRFEGKRFEDLFTSIKIPFKRGKAALSDLVLEVEPGYRVTKAVKNKLLDIRRANESKSGKKEYESLMDCIQLFASLERLEAVYDEGQGAYEDGGVECFCPHCFRFKVREDCEANQRLCDKHQNAKRNTVIYAAAKAKIDKHAANQGINRKYMFEKLYQQRLYSKPYKVFELMAKIGTPTQCEAGLVMQTLIDNELLKVKKECFPDLTPTDLTGIIDIFTSTADFNSSDVKQYFIDNPLSLCQTMIRYDDYLSIPSTDNKPIIKTALQADILACHQKELTNVKIAKKLGCSRQYVSKLIKALSF